MIFLIPNARKVLIIDGSECWKKTWQGILDSKSEEGRWHWRVQLVFVSHEAAKEEAKRCPWDAIVVGSFTGNMRHIIDYFHSFFRGPIVAAALSSTDRRLMVQSGCNDEWVDASPAKLIKILKLPVKGEELPAPEYKPAAPAFC